MTLSGRYGCFHQKITLSSIVNDGVGIWEEIITNDFGLQN